MRRKGEEDLYWLETARLRLNDARRLLPQEGYIHRSLEEMRAALYWAMEAWLLNHGYKPEIKGGWQSMQFQFFKLADQDLVHKVSTVLSRLVFLVYDMEGGFDHQESIPSIEEVRNRAGVLLPQAEEAVTLIGNDMQPPGSRKDN